MFRGVFEELARLGSFKNILSDISEWIQLVKALINNIPLLKKIIIIVVTRQTN